MPTNHIDSCVFPSRLEYTNAFTRRYGLPTGPEEPPGNMGSLGILKRLAKLGLNPLPLRPCKVAGTMQDSWLGPISQVGKRAGACIV